MFLQKPTIRLSADQMTLIELPLDAKIFLEGPAGAGKTTAGVERMLQLMAWDVPANAILVLVPQRTLAEPYLQALNRPGVVAGGVVSILTIGGLAQRMVDLFWPEFAEQAGFARPDQPPVFLTLETAQYYMAHLIGPLFTHGIFDSVTIERNRLYSQILDNLNKAAAVGFPYTEISARLKNAWVGEPGQARVYDDVQECASLFRNYCLEHNLLDFSLQLELFREKLWPTDLCRAYLFRNYRHIIFDNLEEDTPVAHDILGEWLPALESALLIYDWEAGFRRFLGADPETALNLKELCSEQLAFQAGFVMTDPVQALSDSLGKILAVPPPAESPLGVPVESYADKTADKRATHPRGARLTQSLIFKQHHFYPEMLDWVADQIAKLVQDGYPASEIVVLSPFLSDALRFSLINRLQSRQIPTRSHRPSRALRDEPISHCLLTLACLAHPEWGIRPEKYDVIYTLMQAIAGTDLVRAQLLSDIVYRVREGIPVLTSFDQIKSETRARITYRIGERYERLREWLMHRREPPDEFDHFLSRLFGEVLSQPGFGFFDNISAGEVTANLVESVQKFRWVAGEALSQEGVSLGQEYFHMVQQGVIAAQYVRSWQVQPDDAVLVAPAFTFLMSNRPVAIQFWIDVGSHGWSERLNQPLTHSHVLSRGWPAGKLWTDYDEVHAGRQQLNRLTLGLLRRCRECIYLGLSDLGEQGYETRGPLLQALNRVLLVSAL